MSKRGGARPGSGPKLKYGEPTVYVAVKVPQTYEQEIRKKIMRILKKYEKVQ